MTPEAEEWLAFQVATSYGLDKAPIHERMQWVAENDEVISAVALDPWKPTSLGGCRRTMAVSCCV